MKTKCAHAACRFEPTFAIVKRDGKHETQACHTHLAQTLDGLDHDLWLVTKINR